MGVPPVIIHFRLGFSSETIQRAGGTPMTMEIPMWKSPDFKFHLLTSWMKPRQGLEQVSPALFAAELQISL